MTTTVQPKHNKTTAKGIAVCEAAGVEFWSWAPRVSYWGVRAGEFYLVKVVPGVIDPKRVLCKAYTTGETTVHPAPAGI